MSDTISLFLSSCSSTTVSRPPLRHDTFVSYAWWSCAISIVLRETTSFTSSNPRCWCFFVFSPFFPDWRCLHGGKSEYPCLFNQNSRSMVFFGLSTLHTRLIFDTCSGALRHGFSITRINRGLALISSSFGAYGPLPPLSSMQHHEEGWPLFVQIKEARDEHEIYTHIVVFQRGSGNSYQLRTKYNIEYKVYRTSKIIERTTTAMRTAHVTATVTLRKNTFWWIPSFKGVECSFLFPLWQLAAKNRREKKKKRMWVWLNVRGFHGYSLSIAIYAHPDPHPPFSYTKSEWKTSSLLTYQSLLSIFVLKLALTWVFSTSFARLFWLWKE